MLKKPLFKIASLTQTDGQIDAELQIDQHNEIFAGHFPDHPVVPGACMLQIVKEILADTVKADIGLLRADNIKFLSLVEPSTDLLQLNITYQQTDSGLKINASLLAGEIACMKLQGIFGLRYL
jgi:3-hydroxyacyl-[acyl-carrier-protein] dehydratase